jgi:hypothetical protein
MALAWASIRCSPKRYPRVRMRRQVGSHAVVTESEAEPDFTLLPDELQPLAPLIRKYAVADDLARSERLGKSSTNELRELSAAADLHWDATNAYLDENMSPPGPRQDMALALDSFSQAAMEAGLELQNRDAH